LLQKKKKTISRKRLNAFNFKELTKEDAEQAIAKENEDRTTK
jgi:hypothetical protein